MTITALVNMDAVEILDGQELSDRAPLRFHRRLPDYEETPLVDAPALAEVLGVNSGKDCSPLSFVWWAAITVALGYRVTGS